MCGAPAATDATSCDHCGARLATVACPSCFGMMFIGAKFCSHCGAGMARTELDEAPTRLCPRCRTTMKAVVIGSRHLRECPTCEGLWVDASSLEQICADREKQAAILGWTGQGSAAESGAIEKNIRYLPCPDCQKLMNRVNFANYSNVVVDVCKAHGTWFDRDELRRVIEFIRAGGMDSARARELTELQERRHQIKASQAAAAWSSPAPSPTFDHTEREFGLSTVATLLKSFLEN